MTIQRATSYWYYSGCPSCEVGRGKQGQCQQVYITDITQCAEALE